MAPLDIYGHSNRGWGVGCHRRRAHVQACGPAALQRHPQPSSTRAGTRACGFAAAPAAVENPRSHLHGVAVELLAVEPHVVVGARLRGQQVCHVVGVLVGVPAGVGGAATAARVGMCSDCHNMWFSTPHRTTPHRTAPHRTAPHRTAPGRSRMAERPPVNWPTPPLAHPLLLTCRQYPRCSDAFAAHVVLLNERTNI